jgi:hypothetical protein
LTGNSTGLRTVLSSRLSHTELKVHSGKPTVSSVCLPTPQCHHLKAHPFLAIRSADEHRMIYSFSNTTSYAKIYAFFFSDNNMADVANKQQTTALCLSTIVTHTRRHTELTKKTAKPDGKPVLCQRTFSSVFRAVFYAVKLHSLA